VIRPLKLLIAENYEDDAILMVAQLQSYGFDPDWTRVESVRDFEAALAQPGFELVLSDHNMHGFTGIDALRIYLKSGLDIPFILVSGSVGEARAVEAMRMGAHDYIIKDRIQRLGPAVERALHEAATRQAKRAADAELARLHLELQDKMTQLARSHADLEQFTSAASHDLSEPLRTVTSYTQLLVRRYPTPNPESNELITIIWQAVERMRDLTEGLIAYSSAGRKSADGSGAPSGVAQTCNAAQAAEDARALLAGAAGESGAEIVIDPLPPAAIERRALRQVFQHLISNAIKYRRTGQPLRIAISAAKQTGGVEFTVADNGIGIEPKHQEHIFTLFRRLHGNEYPGIGLGLAVAKRIVEHAGGSIWVESIPGAGSTFRFTLPSPAHSAKLAQAASHE
jgi:signal transduction histidine kinase